MKQRIIAIAAILLLCISVVFAHPGDTDANGGHYDRQNGGYHYHHGYPAHDHKDGKCPYVKTKSEQEQERKDAEEKKKKAVSIFVCIGCAVVGYEFLHYLLKDD